MKHRPEADGAGRVDDGRRPADEPPPVGRRWSILYALVLGFLALQILIYWIFTRAFS